MEELTTHALITFLVVMDPFGLAPIFAAMTANHGTEQRRQMLFTGIAVATAVLLLFAFAGNFILQSLGISLPAFRIAGGILLFLIAIDMVFARKTGLSSTTRNENEEAYASEDISVFPLAIPLIAGPGAIASVMLMMSHSQGNTLQQASIIGVLLAILLLTLLLLLISQHILKILGLTGVNVIGRVMGVILSALAVQFIIDGVRTVLVR